VVAFLLKFSFKNVFTEFNTSPHGPLLSVDNFKAYIDSPCSGIEGLTLFIFLNLLIFVLDHKEINKIRSAATLLVGLLGIYGLNILRVYFVYVFGVLYNPKFAIHIYHTNAGWILFILYFIIYWLIIYYYIRKKSNKSVLS
jgi:exosortase/archaeosortase family protein